MVWDAIGTEFGGRNELYEINYAGNQDAIRLDNLKIAESNGQMNLFKQFVDDALSDYDLNGWTSNTWFNPEQQELKV